MVGSYEPLLDEPPAWAAVEEESWSRADVPCEYVMDLLTLTPGYCLVRAWDGEAVLLGVSADQAVPAQRWSGAAFRDGATLQEATSIGDMNGDGLAEVAVVLSTPGAEAGAVAILSGEDLTLLDSAWLSGSYTELGGQSLVQSCR